jgi:SAM-dependent methyltransferase
MGATVKIGIGAVSLVTRSVVSAMRPTWPDEGRVLIQAPLFRRLLESTPLCGAVLNAGCGEGLFAEFLEGYPAVTRIVNVDLGDPEAILRFRSDPRHEAVRASVTDLPFPDASFDAVLCTEVIEHVIDDRRAAFELARVTKPGGTLLVSVPTPPAPPDPAHVREGYTLDELRALLESAGFVVGRHEYCFFDIMRAATRWWQWQWRVLGRGRRNFAPRALVRGFARADVAMPLGKPWDLAVTARRR